MDRFSQASSRFYKCIVSARWHRNTAPSLSGVCRDRTASRTPGWLAMVLLAVCAGAGSRPALAAGTTPLRVVSTPNPNVFPLLLALSEHPDLPAIIVPVADGNTIVDAFTSGQGDALLSMTYTAALDVVTGKVPGLQLVDVTFWRGFWMVAPQSAGISQFSALAGKGVLIAGPTSGGKGGGPDLFFQAAVRRADMTTAAFDLCYLPVMQAAPMIAQQQPMDSNAACSQDLSIAPSAISLVEPAATGLVLQSRMSADAARMTKAIDLQTLFTGYTTWPSNELPHGGVSVLDTVLSDPARQTEIQAVLKAYRAAADEIMAARGHPLAMMEVARAISAGITTYYGQYGLSLPAPVIAASLVSGDLVYRTDLPLAAIQPDLAAFLGEVVGSAPPVSFYHPL